MSSREGRTPQSSEPGDGQPDASDTLHWGEAGASKGPTPGVITRIVVMTRFGISLSVVGVAISCFVLLVYCLIVLARTIYHAFADTSFDIEGAEHLAVELIELTDFFLLGMVLYVVALGMYQLFINPDIPVPGWMRVNSLNDLKSQILNVVVVLLVVTFLASVITWNGDDSVIYFGGAVGIVIISVSVYTLIHNRAEHEAGPK